MYTWRCVSNKKLVGDVYMNNLLLMSSSPCCVRNKRDIYTCMYEIVMGLRPLYIFLVLQRGESNVYRCQILTSTESDSDV